MGSERPSGLTVIGTTLAGPNNIMHLGFRPSRKFQRRHNRHPGDSPSNSGPVLLVLQPDQPGRSRPGDFGNAPFARKSLYRLNF